MTETSNYRLTSGTPVRMVSRVQNWDQSRPEPYIGLNGRVVYDPTLAQGQVAVKFSGRDLGTMNDVTYTIPAKTVKKS